MASEHAVLFEDLDEAEILTENGQVYVFQWLSSLERKLREVSSQNLKPNQQTIETALIKIIQPPQLDAQSQSQSPYPPPGKAIRNLVGRCFVTMYTKGESRTMFDTIQTFLKIAGEMGKGSGDREVNRIAAFSCIGDIMAAFGSQYMSFMAEISTTVLKTFRNSQSSSLLRYHALILLRKSLMTAKKAVTDATMKDIMKQMKNGLTDKSLPIQRAASSVIIAVHSGSDGSLQPSVNDIDSIIGLCVKSLENADQVTRRSLAQVAGHMLALTQVERAVTSIAEAGQKSKDQDDADAGGTPSASLSAGGGGGSASGEAAKKPLLSPTEMLLHLSSHFNKNSATKYSGGTSGSSAAITARKIRIGIIDFYVALFNRLGPEFVESNFSTIVAHLMVEIVGPNSVSTSTSNVSSRTPVARHETLLVRSLVGILLRELIGVRMLSEQGQISAIQELATSYLKRWPAMLPGQSAPSSAVLVIVLREVAGLLQQLGNAPPPVQDALTEPLVTLLAHPSHTTRINAAWALRCFCYSTPLRLAKTILVVTEMLQRDITSITSPAAPSDINLRALGHAYGLASLVSVIPERPLYVSYDVSAKVLDMAISLLKRAGEHDLKVAAVEVEVAWTLIASLMALGPNFVRPHLPQLLVLWRNALPKPTSKDSNSNSGRSAAEWMFLLQVRESALGAVFSFLKHNSLTLVTLDVARRIASLLSNALLFANNFIGQNIDDPAEAMAGTTQSSMSSSLEGATKGLSLRASEALLRRRVFQCFTALGFSSIAESTQVTLLQSAVSLFASPDGYAGSSLQAAIASSSGSFTSVWQSIDGYGYGVTSKQVADEDDLSQGRPDHLNRDSIEVSIDALLRKPVLGACEHDPLSLCQAQISNSVYQLIEPPPPATSVVDTAIELFAQLLPLQDLASTTRVITQLLDSVRSPKLEKNTGRKAAVHVNATMGLMLALRQATTSHFRQAREVFGNSQVSSLLSPFLHEALIDGDILLRSASSECIGRLASLSGTNFLTSQIKDLVDQVVSNRDPHGRAGCALAFGAIYSHVGGLAAGPLLKTTVNLLMSLGNDPHPVVHFWALSALARVINAASLAYAPFVSSTLGMLLKIYLMESHECEGGTVMNANLSGDNPAYPVICQIIDAVISVLGPDMQDSSRTRTLILNLVHEFSVEEDEGISVEAIKCIQHFLMFAPEHVNIPDLVTQFRSHLSSPRRPLKLASINALYQLVQKDALSMSKLGGDQLVEDLFSMLDDDSSVQGVRNVISSWLEQTVVHNPSAWIDLCQRIMSRTTASQQVADAATGQGLRDDEGESLNLGRPQDGTSGGRTHLTSRWRTQLFALQCLHHICIIVAKSGRREHLDILYARTAGMATNGLLVSRIPDLIKMAFTASTAYVTEIRLEGLVVLRDVIEIFAAVPDPAYPDALLLEQHQAPVTAALTPAFSADSTPEILASAVDACAVFVGCGVVKEVSRMGRILKLLTTALEQSKDSGMFSLGETGELSPNASAMLKISTLSAWAQLQVATSQQKYLENVVNPHRSTLASLWVASLRDYASIRVDSEFLNDTSTVALDSSYSSLGKEVLLPYYSKSWPVILQAVATSMESGDPYVLAAMDGQEYRPNPQQQNTARRQDPTAFFHIIFGLVYEALVNSSADSASASSARQQVMTSSLLALKSLVRPEYSGRAINEPAIFDEFISLCYRMAMTEPANIQVHLVEMLSSFASSQETHSSNDELSLTSPRAHCLRICAHILRHSTSASRGQTIHGDISDRIKMINSAFQAFHAVGHSVTSAQREDVRAVAILLYSDLLKDESSEIDLVGPTLPALKMMLDLPIIPGSDINDQYGRLVHGLLSSCLLNIDAMSGRHGLISTKKIKNNLLAAVLILTVIPPPVKVSQSVVEHCCFLISQKLSGSDEMSLTAAHCAKTLVVASGAGNAMLRQCVRHLIPGLIEFIAKVAPVVHDGSMTEPQVAALGEVWKAFSSWFSSTPEESRVRLLGVLLPTVALLLSDTQRTMTPVTSQTISQLLFYATSSPAAFKDAAAKLDDGTRELLEQSIRRAVGGTTSPTAPAATKPQISLRAF